MATTHQIPPIRRHADGTIDAAHYTKRARRMRRFAWRQLFARLIRPRRTPLTGTAGPKANLRTVARGAG